MSLYTLLEWDTRILKVASAKILPNTLDKATLSQCLDELREQKIQLVYWCAAATQQNQMLAEQFQGLLTDIKLTYACALNKLFAKNNFHNISLYSMQDPNETLLNLAYESGKYCRFRQDPHLTETQFKDIYREWMINSTQHRIANDVMVIQDQSGIAGMVTLGEKNARGDIGLLAVAEYARGKGYGKQLVYAAQHYFKNHGFSQSQVVTQEINIPACKLYESCGYKIDQREFFYHFWLD